MQQALATYKSNLYNYYSLKENLALANEVYDVIRLQYRSGIKILPRGHKCRNRFTNSTNKFLQCIVPVTLK